jgi:hypothetical protein
LAGAADLTEPDEVEGDMGLLLRFPIERTRSAPAEIVAEEEAKILILPAVRIERNEGELDAVLPEFDHQSPGEPSSAGGRRRRRTPRN